MQILDFIMLPFGVLGILFLVLMMALPIGHLVARHRLTSWPSRPMTDGERRARWAVRYHQATPVTPNQHPWAWLQKWKPLKATGSWKIPTIEETENDQ